MITYNGYVRREAVDEDTTIDIIDITAGDDNVPDWRYRFTDDLGISEQVLQGRAEWLENNPEPTYATPIATDEELAEQAREDRDTLLARADGASIKHREQVDLGTTHDLTAGQYTALLQYKQDLRDVPAQAGFPQTIIWPTWPF